MADFHYREKLKQIEKAASTNLVPEGAKNVGMGCFVFVFILLISFLIFLSISLWINEIIVGSLLTGILVLFVSLFYIRSGRLQRFHNVNIRQNLIQ